MNPAIAPTKTIDGLTFQVSMLDLDTSFEVLARATRLFGPTLAALFMAAGGRSVGDVNSNVAATALSKVAESLSAADLKFFRDAFASCSSVQINGGWMPMTSAANTVLRGKMGAALKWMWFAFQVNYADFLGDATTMLRPPNGPPAPAASPSDSPQG